jgi:hypothetical protein
MPLRFAPVVFMIAYCCAYALTFALDWPLFRYYPLHGNFTWGWHTLGASGPAMVWYGLVASAGTVAALLAVCIRDSGAERLRGYSWLFPAATLLVCCFLLRHFFK